MTIAGPGILFLLTTTLSTYGWSSFLNHNEKPVISSSLILAYPWFYYFCGLAYSAPFKALSISSWSVSTFENLSPSYVSIYLKINSSIWVVAIRTGMPALVKG